MCASSGPMKPLAQAACEGFNSGSLRSKDTCDFAMPGQRVEPYIFDNM
jgi:hypothetical protein